VEEKQVDEDEIKHQNVVIQHGEKDDIRINHPADTRDRE